MFYGIDSISSENIPQSEAGTSEISTRMQDIEYRLPKVPTPTTDHVPIAFLDDTADLAQVIKVINELIKRDLTVKRVE